MALRFGGTRERQALWMMHRTGMSFPPGIPGGWLQLKLTLPVGDFLHELS